MADLRHMVGQAELRPQAGVARPTAPLASQVALRLQVHHHLLLPMTPQTNQAAFLPQLRHRPTAPLASQVALRLQVHHHLLLPMKTPQTNQAAFLPQLRHRLRV
jgi:hypothetical protein